MPQEKDIKKLLDAGLLREETAKEYIERNLPLNKKEAERNRNRFRMLVEELKKTAL